MSVEAILAQLNIVEAQLEVCAGQIRAIRGQIAVLAPPTPVPTTRTKGAPCTHDGETFTVSAVDRPDQLYCQQCRRDVTAEVQR